MGKRSVKFTHGSAVVSAGRRDRDVKPSPPDGGRRLQILLERNRPSLAIAMARELFFCRPREFRFDCAWPFYLAIEVEGGARASGRRRGRHVRPEGYETDCEKYRLAALGGWLLLRYTTHELDEKTPLVLDEIEFAIKTARRRTHALQLPPVALDCLKDADWSMVGGDGWAPEGMLLMVAGENFLKCPECGEKASLDDVPHNVFENGQADIECIECGEHFVTYVYDDPDMRALSRREDDEGYPRRGR